MSKIFYHISDWHTDDSGMNRMLQYELYSLPEHLQKPDFVVITGDMVYNTRHYRFARTVEEQIQSRAWDMMMAEAERWWPDVDIIAVRGNHDFFELDHPTLFRVLKYGESFELGGYKWSGMCGVPTFMDTWNDELSEDQLRAISVNVPLDTEILLTHCPPRGILDDAADARCYECGQKVDPSGLCPKGHAGPVYLPREIGSFAIRELVDRLPNLKAHFFGHVHECGDRVETHGQTIFSNASCTLNVVVVP